MKKIFLSALFFQVCLTGIAQHKATVKEFRKYFTTFPFSDPGPLPDPSSKIYPYFRYDGFSSNPDSKIIEWAKGTFDQKPSDATGINDATVCILQALIDIKQ